MNILLLASFRKNKSGNIFGGAEKSITNLSNWLSGKGHNVVLASVEGAEMPYSISIGVKTEFCRIYSQNKIRIHMEVAKNTIRLIKKYRPDIIISFWIHPLFYGLLSMKIRRIPFLYSERNDPKKLYSFITKAMRFFVMKYARGIVFQTQEAQTYFSENIQEKSRVIHNPTYIEYNQYPFIEKTDNRIVSVGRLNEQKNYPLLIKEFSILFRNHPDLVLEIYGEGPMKTELEQLISELKLENHIKLMGTYTNILDKIYGSKLFVMSSDYEGMPNALIEAMCLGITCICSDCPCGGPRELISHGENGYLFKVGDMRGLVETLEMALKKDNTELRLKAKEICRTHNQDRIFGKWIEFIHEA